MHDLKELLKTAASGPKRAKGDAAEVEQYSLKDLIEADKYLAAKEAMKDPAKGFKRVKIVPPGTV